MSMQPTFHYLRFDTEKREFYISKEKDKEKDSNDRRYGSYDELIEKYDENGHLITEMKTTRKVILKNEVSLKDKSIASLPNGEELDSYESSLLDILDNDTDRIIKVMLEIGKMIIDKDDAFSIWTEVGKNVSKSGLVKVDDTGWLQLPTEDEKVHELIVKFYDVKDRIILPEELGIQINKPSEFENDPEYKKSYIGGMRVTRDHTEFVKNIESNESKNRLIKSYEEHLDVLTDTLKYAKEDLQHVLSSYDVSDPEKRIRAEESVQFTEKEIDEYKKKLSELRKI